MYNQVISGVNSEYDILLEECDVDSILKGNTEFYEPAVVDVYKRQDIARTLSMDWKAFDVIGAIKL